MTVEWSRRLSSSTVHWNQSVPSACFVYQTRKNGMTHRSVLDNPPIERGHIPKVHRAIIHLGEFWPKSRGVYRRRPYPDHGGPVRGVAAHEEDSAAAGRHRQALVGRHAMRRPAVYSREEPPGGDEEGYLPECHSCGGVAWDRPFAQARHFRQFSVAGAGAGLWLSRHRRSFWPAIDKTSFAERVSKEALLGSRVELCVASDILMMSGCHCISWSRFRLDLMERVRPTAGIPVRMVLADTKGTMSADSVRYTIPYKLVALRDKILSGGGKCKLGSLFYFASESKATDPRDRVYSLLGMANDVSGDDVPLDYSLSPCTVCCAATRVIYKSLCSGDSGFRSAVAGLVSWCSHDPLLGADERRSRCDGLDCHACGAVVILHLCILDRSLHATLIVIY